MVAMNDVVAPPGCTRGEGIVSTSRRRVLVVENDRRQTDQLKRLLGTGNVDAVIASTRPEAEALLQHTRFDLALLDLDVPEIDGVDLITKIRSRWPVMRALVISVAATEARILAALQAGACGFLYKEDLGTRLVAAIDEALEGGAPLSSDVARMLVAHVQRSDAPPRDPRADTLTERERIVLRLFAGGERYEDVARSMAVSVNTVRTHVRSIYDKLDVCSKTEAVVVATRLGLLTRTDR